MSKEKNGGFAFPVQSTKDIHGYGEDGRPAMTLRDYFAAKALEGMLADSSCNPCADVASEIAYNYADAMLKAREQC